jgi:hypothetical protein
LLFCWYVESLVWKVKRVWFNGGKPFAPRGLGMNADAIVLTVTRHRKLRDQTAAQRLNGCSLGHTCNSIAVEKQ